MRRRIFYGSLQQERKQNKKRNIIITVVIVVIVALSVWAFLFLSAGYRKDVGTAVKESIEEITELKLQLQEKDDQIEMLNQTIAEYEAELAVRPTIPPTQIQPPNDAVSAAQQTPAPTKKPSVKSNKATPTPTSALPTQPSVQTQDNQPQSADDAGQTDTQPASAQQPLSNQEPGEAAAVN